MALCSRLGVVVIIRKEYVMEMDKKSLIESGKAILGIELGSTRIKAVLIDESGNILATGGHGWENKLENGVWTYSLEDVWTGLKDCYKNLKADVLNKYGITLKTFASMGVSAMMHGYLAFDKDGELLIPFRTWRNTITGEASKELTKELNYNIPQRWSVSHLYQSILNKEEHVSKIDFLTTLAGYVHWKLTGEKVLGVGDASGMFPIDIENGNYNKILVEKFEKLVELKGHNLKFDSIMPKVMVAGEMAGTLTLEGARLLDESGDLEAGIPLCPPEGDAGTGMVATNSVGKKTGNISAGTSIFAMVVLERELSKVYPEIDLVTTPDGALVGMVHCNNCTSEINAWVNLFKEYSELMGYEVDMNNLFTRLYSLALSGDEDCGGLLSYNYTSGEHVTGFSEGAPLFVRKADNKFNLANVMRTHLYSALATLKIGLDIMLKEEGVQIDTIYGHGGYFKTKGVGQRFAAAATKASIAVMETAGEGGAWGIAILAAYMVGKKEKNLQNYLNEIIFAGNKGEIMEADAKDVAGFEKFMENYRRGISIERAAVETLR